ncbi:MAG: fasciclin domain-containing protein [Actinomycetota bacterium]
MPTLLRRIALITALALAVAACGDSDGGDDTDGTTTTATEAPATTAEATEPSDTTATTESDEAPADSGFPRTIEHSLGTLELDSQPEVVVALFSEGMGEQLLALGITPAGSLPYVSALPATGETYGLETLYDVEPIGADFNPNLELIAALRPDLILVDDVFLASLYDSLEEIAPTFAYDPFSDWRTAFRSLAEVVGAEEQAEAVIADYEARVAELAPAVQEFFGDGEVAILQGVLANEQSAGGGEGARIYGADTDPGQFLQGLGLTVWEPEDPGGSEIADSTFEVSAEVIADVDADAILYLREDAFFASPEAIAEDPIWQATGAASSGNLYFLEFGAQARLGGPLSKFIALDAMQALITGTEIGEGDVPEVEAPEDAGGGSTIVEAAEAAGATFIPQFAAFSAGFNEAITGEGPVTAFFPTDEAFFAAQATDVGAALTEDFALLDEFLQYHAVPGVALTAADVIAAGQLDTVLGEPITVTVEGDTVVLNGGQATVAMADLVADNGVAHLIDGLLIPPSRVDQFG